MPPGKCRQPNSKRKWAGLFEKDAQLEASIRAKVEHPFHVIQTLLDHRKTRDKGLAKNEPAVQTRTRVLPSLEQDGLGNVPGARPVQLGSRVRRSESPSGFRLTNGNGMS